MIAPPLFEQVFDYDNNAQFAHESVPKQTNGCDCGNFICQLLNVPRVNFGALGEAAGSDANALSWAFCRMLSSGSGSSSDTANRIALGPKKHVRRKGEVEQLVRLLPANGGSESEMLEVLARKPYDFYKRLRELPASVAKVSQRFGCSLEPLESSIKVVGIKLSLLMLQTVLVEEGRVEIMLSYWTRLAKL
uniref:Ubiquitin-like protease family profile domain-containing protein n=1 Tax=Ditylenchus dipsaci TaxID=166011 RepID=A0A915D0X6_9BILA